MLYNPRRYEAQITGRRGITVALAIASFWLACIALTLIFLPA